MLHLTNGDSAVPAVRAAGAEGEILPWREILHDGPVPPLEPKDLRAVRARFLGDDEGRLARRDNRLAAAIAAREPLMLWLEADLYDVLLLLQILERLPPEAPARLVLVGRDEWRSVTQLAAEELSALGHDAPEVTPEQRTLAASAWAAFTAEDPRALEPLAAGTPGAPGGRAGAAAPAGGAPVDGQRPWPDRAAAARGAGERRPYEGGGLPRGRGPRGAPVPRRRLRLGGTRAAVPAARRWPRERARARRARSPRGMGAAGRALDRRDAAAARPRALALGSRHRAGVGLVARDDRVRMRRLTVLVKHRRLHAYPVVTTSS